MDLSKYGNDVAELRDKILETIYDSDNRVFTYLRKLEKIAKGADGNELLGFVYYNYALANYARDNHKEVLRYLKLAISNLVRQDDIDTLAAAYNIFAIEAKTNGCFEVALDYYLTAHSLVEDEKDSLAYALTGANIADLLAQMGEYKRAYKDTGFIRKAIKIFEKDKNQASSIVNLAMFHVNLGLAALNNDKYEEALAEEAKLEKIGASAIQEMGDTIVLYYLIFRLRLAIEAENKAKIKSLVKELEEGISRGLILSELVQETLDVFDKLINHGDLKAAELLLYTLENKTEMNNYARLVFIQSKIKYYNAVGDKKKCMECYEERSRCMQRHNEIQNSIYYESITLMEMLEELRKEEEIIRLNNIEIQKNAETDSLTGIPNRYAMDRYLDYYFSESKKNQVRFGIGIVDIDRFKDYNDTYGHIRGDQCLIEVAKTLEEIADRHGLSLARYGGDEFVLIYYNLQSKEIRAIEKEINNMVSVSVTHGFCNEVPGVESKIYDYLSKADQKLYKKKQKSGVYDTWT